MSRDFKITSVIVYFDGDRVEEYNDVVGFDSDTGLGFPRISIVDSQGVIENINLNKVESWQVFTEKEVE